MNPPATPKITISRLRNGPQQPLPIQMGYQSTAIKTAEVSEERLSAKVSGPDSDIKDSNSKLRKVCSNFFRYR